MAVAETAPLLASLLSLPSEGRYARLALSPEQQKEQTMAAWTQWVIGLSQRDPVLLVVEDAHWSDPTTLEALGEMIDRAQAMRVLLLFTFRRSLFRPGAALRMSRRIRSTV